MNNKMIEVAKRGLALEENFKLDMGVYCSEKDHTKAKPECGTAFCFAGILAYLDKFPEEFIKDGVFDYELYYELYSKDLIGVDECNDENWHFLFNSDWNNSFSCLKKRCQYIVDNDGDIPEIDQWINFGWEG